MRRFYIVSFFVIIISSFFACNENIIDDTHEDGIKADSTFSYLKINKDASNSELLSVITNSGDTISYYGQKKSDGTTQSIQNIEFCTHDNTHNIIDFDNNGKLVSLTNNLGVSINFEWQSDYCAIVKAYSQKDNFQINTIVDFSNNNVSKLLSGKESITRSVESSLNIIPNEGYTKTRELRESRANLDPDEFPDYQEIHLWVTQCGSNYNAENYILLRNASNNITIGKIFYYDHWYKGNYAYKLPLSSYPCSATNQELCANIDEALDLIEKGLSGALSNTDALILALDAAAAATGIGVIPAGIITAVVVIGELSDFGLQLLSSKGGVAGLAKRIDADWYYKEYIVSDLKLIPIGFSQSQTVMGEEYIVTPSEESVFMVLEMPGNPVINSFDLNPSNPGQGVGYTATADFHCIPENSTITLNIVGTDGYKDSKTESISGSGTAVLNVPGAATGVQDLCTAIINMPFGETLTMKASLVFGN